MSAPEQSSTNSTSGQRGTAEPTVAPPVAAELPCRSSRLAQFLAYLTAWAIVLPIEVLRWRALPVELRTVWGWFHHLSLDSSLYVVLLVVVPIVWRLRSRLLDLRTVGLGFLQRPAAQPGRYEADGFRMGSARRAACLALLVGAASLAVSASVGANFDDLPPAYHDEYSYLFQAKTFLAGHVSFPSHAARRLFDQMHVLNEGHFASRYFPGTGLWMMPFVACGKPYWGHWLAGSVCAMLLFFTGREIAGDGAGLMAGLLTAVSPGMALFSNLLLAHHPTLVGLSLFWFGFFRMLRLKKSGWALASGTGLAFAALCRPMTAAGVGLPFGIYLLWWLWRGARTKEEPGDCRTVPLTGELQLESPDNSNRLSSALMFVAAMGFPLLIGGTGMFLYNRAITGNGWETPYGQYLDIYTPRHVYGFNNAIRGESRRGPRVLVNYDDWAENLTPRLAVENVWRRLIASWRWTLGIVPLAMSLVAGLADWRRQSTGGRLILASIGSLHAVHIPYWYDGIMHFHYVFESVPLWGLWFGTISVQLLCAWRAEGRRWMPLWWSSVIGAALLTNYGTCDDRWRARISEEITNIEFARKQYGRFANLIARNVHPRPALVLVESDPTDRHIDYVVNDPSLDSDVLFGRFLPDQVPIPIVARLFRGRSLFLYHARERRLVRIR